jgi:hypothetical protein
MQSYHYGINIKVYSQWRRNSRNFYVNLVFLENTKIE